MSEEGEIAEYLRFIGEKKKSGDWPKGPWMNEPDRVDWRSPEGLPCFVQRNMMGSLCGYVGVPEGHPLHGVDYGKVDAEAPGGVTYSQGCAGHICLRSPRGGSTWRYVVVRVRLRPRMGCNAGICTPRDPHARGAVSGSRFRSRGYGRSGAATGGQVRRCVHCDEELQEKELFGWLLAIHRECLIWQIVGPVEHQNETCACFDGSKREDPHLSVRENAKLAAAFYDRRHRPNPLTTH